jgi:peptidoglycan/LPS O-acetylase OafA/YrhL
LSTPKVQFAHYLRGIASLSVLVNHLCGVFWLSPVASILANTPSYSGTIPVIVLMINSIPDLNYGLFGVSLFFLISGFVIPFSLRKYDSFQFLCARFFRIVPPYIAGFSITILALIASSAYFGKQFLYSAWTVLVNAFFIQDLLVLPSIDGIIWTLEIELKFYIICAVIILWIKHYEFKKILLLCFGFFIGMLISLKALSLISGEATFSLIVGFIYVYQLDFTMITFMFIGTMVYFYYFGKISAKELILAIVFLFSLFSIDYSIGVYKQVAFSVIKNFVLAFLIFILFFYLRDKPLILPVFSQIPNRYKIVNFWNSTSKIISEKLTEYIEKIVKPGLSKLADISYSLYIVHGISSYVLMSILLDLGLTPVMVIVIAIINSLILAYLLHRFIEEPSNALGKKIALNMKHENQQE